MVSIQLGEGRRVNGGDQNPNVVITALLSSFLMKANSQALERIITSNDMAAPPQNELDIVQGDAKSKSVPVTRAGDGSMLFCALVCSSLAM